MKAIIVEKEAIDNLIRRIDEIHEDVKSKNLSPEHIVYDNYRLQEELNISSRLAQSWRDQGIITFSQIGNKIYYKLSDVLDMLNQHINPAFKKK